MADVVENALHVAKVMLQKHYFGNNSVKVKTLKTLTNLTSEDFERADTYLLQGKYCSGTLGGNEGLRTLTVAGIDLVKTYQDNKKQKEKNIEAENILQADILYGKIQKLNEDWNSPDASEAKLIKEYAVDAIKLYGETNQKKKLELKAIVEKTEEVIPPENLKQLKDKSEKYGLQKIYSWLPFRKNFLYIVILIVLAVFPLVGLFNFLKPEEKKKVNATINENFQNINIKASPKPNNPPTISTVEDKTEDICVRRQNSENVFNGEIKISFTRIEYEGTSKKEVAYITVNSPNEKTKSFDSLEVGSKIIYKGKSEYEITLDSLETFKACFEVLKVNELSK